MNNKINVQTFTDEELASALYWIRKEQKRRRVEKRDSFKQKIYTLMKEMEEEGFTLVLRENDDWLYFEDLTIVPVSSSPDWDLDDDEEE